MKLRMVTTQKEALINGRSEYNNEIDFLQGASAGKSI